MLNLLLEIDLSYEVFYVQNKFSSMKAVYAFLLFAWSVTSHAQQFLADICGLNAYVHLPDDYDYSGHTYPVIIFFPAMTEIGRDDKKLLVYGPAKFIQDGYNMQFNVDGVLEKPIILAIQPIDA